MAGPDIGEPRNRETPVTQAPETVDLLAGIPEIGQAIKQGISKKVIDNTRQEMEEAVENVASEAAAEVTQAQEVPQAGQDLTGDPQVDAVRGEINRLRAIVGATSGSAQARAELELRRVVTEAGSKFRGLRTELAQEMRLFEATDPEYQTLAMLDTERDLLNKEAQAELEEIRDFAYSRAPDGLGLSPGLHTFGSKEFSAHVAYKGALIEEAQTRMLVLQDVNTQSQIDAESKAQNAINFFKGPGAPYRQAIELASADMWAAAEAARNVGSPGASEQLLAWEQGGKQQVVAELQAVRADAVAQMGQLFSSRELAVSETAKQAQATLEAELEALDQVLDALTGDSTDWSVVKAYEAYNTSKQAQFDARFPETANARLLLKNLVPFIEASDGAFGNMDAIPKNALANYSINTMNTIGGFLGVTHLMSGGGQIGLVGEQSPSQLLATMDGVLMDNNQYLTQGQTGNLASQTQGNLWANIQSGALQGQEVSPVMANQLILAHGTAFKAVANGPVYADISRDTLLTLRGPEVLTRARQAAELGNPMAGVALGLAAREIDLQYQPIRDSEWRTALNSPVGGVQAQDVLVVDVDALEQGKVQFVVNDEAIARVATVEDPLSGVGAQTLRSQALDQAHKMTKQFTEDLEYLANMDALQLGSNTPDYVMSYKRHGFEQYLAEVDDE